MDAPIPLLPALLFFISLLPYRAMAVLASSDLRFNFCVNASFQNGSSFDQNLRLLLASLKAHSSLSLYDAISKGTGGGRVYGVFQCQGDLSLPDCSSCISQITDYATSSCLNKVGARVQDDHCFLRYENQSFLTPNFDLIEWAWSPDNDTDPTFVKNVDSVLNTVITTAPKRNGYDASYAGETVTTRVYGLAQCLGYLSPNDCSQCLSRVSGFRQLSHLNSSAGGRVYYSTCYFRYEAYFFFNNVTTVVSPTPSIGPSSVASSPERQSVPSNLSRDAQGSSKHATPIIVGASIASVATLLLCLILAIWRRKHAKRIKRHVGVGAGGQAGENLHVQFTQFQQTAKVYNLDQLREATRNFDPEKKLGEGGFGVVYKGILEDGQDVAIKKLSTGSRQGKRQFLNEVGLLTTVQHRNLIRLFGCCAEGSERILVYEFLQKGSLETHLFDPKDSVALDWHTRREIIIGIAKGLAYLHEDSPMRIVHRDIKASNILLDDNLNPKIADFGLARLFAGDETHVSTGVAGTLGYLAPEYAMHGQLTEKVDIFSFGVLCLEIVSGRRNTELRLPPEKQRLLEWAWKQYKDMRPLVLADGRLGENFFGEEVVRVVHVALLCTQAQAGLRPAMSRVVLMLVGRSEILERPTKPAFINLSSDAGAAMGPVRTASRTAMMYLPPVHAASSSSSSSSSTSTPLLSIESQANASMSEVAEPR